MQQLRLNTKEYKAYQEKFQKPQNTKYGNKRQKVDGIIFDSNKELLRYHQLMVLERIGEISDLKRQVSFELVPAMRLHGEKKIKEALCYVADFTYVNNKTGNLIIEDVKSTATSKDKMFRLKKHLMKFLLGLDIVEHL